MPSLGDHVFVPVTAISEPFITTFVQNSVSLGSIDATVPVSLLDSTLVAEIPADQLVAILGARYQHAVNEWLAAGLSLGVVGRVGTSTTTVLVEGLTGDLRYNLGWLVRLYQSNTLILSGSVKLGNHSATIINVQEWAESIGSEEDASLVNNRQSLRGAAGLQAGWGISRRFGLLGSVIMSYAESFDGQRANAWDSDVRLSFSYDLERDVSVPLGLALTGGRSGNNVDTDSETGVWFWTLRVATQSRSNFTIGLDLQNAYARSSTSRSDQHMMQFTFDMRYFY